MLALWSHYPTGSQWAPAPPEHLVQLPCLNAKQASQILEEVFWKHLETVFSVIRWAFIPGRANPAFAGYNVQPPLFYFAEPTTLPHHATNYITTAYGDVSDLVKVCLGSDDPFSLEVSWSILEGDFLTLRRANEDGRNYLPWYLILPIARKRSAISQSELETDLSIITNSLNYVEFAISHAAWDIDTDREALASREAHWQGTLNSLSEIIAKVVGFLPFLERQDVRKVNTELEKLLIPLRQVQAYLEKANGAVKNIHRKLNNSIDGTEDYLRRRLTLAPFPDSQVTQLRHALLDAYPFHFVTSPLESLQETNNYLLGSVERTLETVNALLAEADRRSRESMTRWTERLSIILPIIALVIALPAFIPDAVLRTGQPGLQWLDPYLPTIAIATSYSVGIASIGLLIILILFVLSL